MRPELLWVHLEPCYPSAESKAVKCQHVRPPGHRFHPIGGDAQNVRFCHFPDVPCTRGVRFVPLADICEFAILPRAKG
jgi:hypothetical protein